MDTDVSWTPPTATPEAGQGPWVDCGDYGRWWVVAPELSAAIAVIEATDSHAFPIYYGWRAIAERVSIRWVDVEDYDEENEIVECTGDEDGAAEAWRIVLEDR